MSLPRLSSINPAFHHGEIALQKKLGIDKEIGERTNGFIRSYMPEQHRQFFTSCPFTVLALVDDEGYPVAVPVWGEGDFIESPSPTQLRFRLQVHVWNMMLGALNLDVISGSKIGIVGIEYATRRRNRLNGTINHATKGNLTVLVDQSFGNCPQYIHKRNTTKIQRLAIDGHPENNASYNVNMTTTTTNVIDTRARTIIESAETFFIASRHSSLGQEANEGLDVSHRGGKAGFVNVKGNTITFPDFSGNKFFNTLGNILLDPRVGLCFWDNETGDLFFVKAKAKVEPIESKASVIKGAEFKDAERFVSLSVMSVTHIAGIYPYSHEITDMSPYALQTGDWK
ncbi:flavin-nucleotide-binding protein [Alteromonas mediterranea]|uniref:pyridoxamine 5'-phosphate oxidase family protein n=1 Tax=Alteromonas mediterranea TaxID=314275 RepID=UPI00090430A8|nr:pyridoxamine 5'-phosphate oxidase family protein [Alteromonas mediterranea]APD93870.1 flavin-nucleotide-binding protein [Alteromonas mediterranea]APD97496.1 flavin-nucleotide-binding protein [Alteromonas mediterranea]QDG34624.1 flavin-nucleotide-binding protein [Alteromonas mediterranea]